MTIRFTVLASGSGGNSSLLQSEGFGLLLDVGLGPRQLGSRLAAVGHSWDDVHAVILTHTHGDHWRDASFSHLLRRRIPIWCHQEHPFVLLRDSRAFGALRAAGLTRSYDGNAELTLGPGLRCQPISVRHDGGPTFGFRFEGRPNEHGFTSALGYVADLGCWTLQIAQALADVDLLALEFNHDVRMQRTSNRSPTLIARVLSDHGHLSNEQAAGMLREVIRCSTPGRVRHLVQLHLSRECNRRELAAAAARRTLVESGESSIVLTAEQDRPLPTLTIAASIRVSPVSEADGAPTRSRTTRDVLSALPALLPGFEA